MKFDVKLFVGGKVFEETVQAVNRNNAIDTAKARNPHARVIGVNPICVKVNSKGDPLKCPYSEGNLKRYQ